MLVTKKRYERHIAALSEEYMQLAVKYAELLRKHDDLVDRINTLGGEDFLVSADKRLTPSDLETLVRLCHPDKHANSRASNEMTQKLLSWRQR